MPQNTGKIESIHINRSKLGPIGYVTETRLTEMSLEVTMKPTKLFLDIMAENAKTPD